MVEYIKKNLIPILIVVGILLIAGTFIYLDLGKDLRQKGVALLGQPESPAAEQNGQSQAQSQAQTQVTVASVEELAKCMTQKGVKFYGASWCGHCANQKKLLGDAMQYITYVECWDDANNTLTQTCVDAKIEAFPTWDFPGGNRQLGELSLEKLGELSGCQLQK